MAQSIKQNGVTIMTSPCLYLCGIVFNNLTGDYIKGQERKQYLKMMFHDFPRLTYGEIELWEDGECKCKGNIKH